MTAEQRAAFTNWWALYKSDKEPSIMPAASIAQAAFLAGHSAAVTEHLLIEERVRTERNELADHLRKVLRAARGPADPEATAAASAYLQQIGAA